MTEFRDSNGDGIPDAFENRRSISEILNDDLPATTSPASLLVEIELVPRVPKLGELYLVAGNIKKAEYEGDADSYRWPIVKVLRGDLDQYDYYLEAEDKARNRRRNNR